EAFLEDLKWFGCRWDEGPDIGGPYASYSQSERMDLYRLAFQRLRQTGWVYPCSCSRKDVLRALQAPHAGEEEPLYPGTCRNKRVEDIPVGMPVSWRFRVPEGEEIIFEDGGFGQQRFICGKDFGDFIVWRHDEVPAYQLACTVDDHAMQMSEVVRGADLLMSTARQMLLYRALGWEAPAFFHCELIRDEQGQRLAKRHDSLSLRALRQSGADPAVIRADSW
ncbi:MAG: glutamate--tRNA ligase family protein, partial [Limisphaerales bacterium]